MKISLKIIFIFLVLGFGISNAQEIQDTLKSRITLNFKPKYNLDTNYFNIFPKKYNNKKVALVLSGGGARGIAQIGVLDALEENDINIDLIVGTSIGSVIGGLYSSGENSEQLKKIVENIDWVNKLSLTNRYERESLFLEQKQTQDKSLLSISLDGFIPEIPSSISSGYNMLKFINLLFINSYLKPKSSFRDLSIPFISVATDLDKGERVDIKRGNISEAVKASLTFPLLYSPTIINGRNLVDGGLTSNIPVDVAKENGADFTIAINSTSPLWSRDELDNPINTADQIVSITMAKLNELQLSRANFVITPDIGNFLATNFTDFNYLISQGKYSALSEMKNLKAKIDSIEDLSSNNYNNFVISPRIEFNSENIPDSIKYDIILAQSNQFVRYTTIEKTLKKIYNLGIYQNVFADVYRDSQGVIIKYNLIANPVLFDVKIQGKFNFLDSLMTAFKQENIGNVINSKSAYQLYENIYEHLRNNNLPVAEIQQFYFNPDEGVLEIKISDGSINNIYLKGNKLTNNDVILRELKISDNKIAYYKDFEETLSNIFSTNLFKQISIDFDYSHNEYKPDVIINLIEKSSKNLRLSMRADNERNLQLFADLRDENLFGTNNELGLNAFGGLRNREFKFELKSNRFFSTYYTYNLNFFYKFWDIYSYEQVIDADNDKYNRNYLGDFTDVNYGISFTLGKQLERLGTVYGQLIFEKLKTDDNVPGNKNQSEFNVLKLTFGGKIDTRDKIPFPTKGTVVDFSYQSAQDNLIGNLSYSILNLDFEYNISINNFNTIKPKFTFGFGDKTTPISEQFALGGENSFYGMVENELRGRQILLISLEYRYNLPFKLFFDTYLLARYDIGQIWDNAEDVRFKDLRHGMGLSLQFDTPVGKASFSGGRSLIINKGFTNNSFIWGPYTFYFSIGYDF